MRRRPTLAALVALCSLVLIVAGCGSDDGDEDTAGSTTTAAPEAESSTTAAADAAPVDCAAYTTVVGLFSTLEDIATGSNDGQVAADESLATAVDALRPAAVGDDALTGALDTLGQVSFQVTDEDTGPTSDEVDSARAALDDAWADECVTPTEEGDDGVTEEVPTEEQPECPDPATLEAEGFTCDSEGHLTPIDEETATECPSPETLEAEGFTCDSEGNLTPIEGTEDPAPTEDPVECPAPEVLEAEGYTCDENGVLTPIP